MNEPSDLVHFILGTKAETLSRIKPKLKKKVKFVIKLFVIGMNGKKILKK